MRKKRKRYFYIPVGGGIEFGESSLIAARREVKEETGEEIENEKLLNISENIFTFNGIPEHEIVFVYSAEFKNKEAYTSPLKAGINTEGNAIKLVWASIEEIRNNNIKLYPSSLLDILSKA